MKAKPRWKDAEGNLYADSEVALKDIDTPGAQFLGYVTKASARQASIDAWVRVVPIKKDFPLEKGNATQKRAANLPNNLND